MHSLKAFGAMHKIDHTQNVIQRNKLSWTGQSAIILEIRYTGSNRFNTHTHARLFLKLNFLKRAPIIIINCYDFGFDRFCNIIILLNSNSISILGA